MKGGCGINENLGLLSPRAGAGGSRRMRRVRRPPREWTRRRLARRNDVIEWRVGLHSGPASRAPARTAQTGLKSAHPTARATGPASVAAHRGRAVGGTRPRSPAAAAAPVPRRVATAGGGPGTGAACAGLQHRQRLQRVSGRALLRLRARRQGVPESRQGPPPVSARAIRVATRRRARHARIGPSPRAPRRSASSTLQLPGGHRLHGSRPSAAPSTRPICTAANDCPSGCSTDADCDTASGDRPARLRRRARTRPLRPWRVPQSVHHGVPKQCASSADCSGSTTSPICCQGLRAELPQELQPEQRLQRTNLLQVSRAALAAPRTGLRGHAHLHGDAHGHVLRAVPFARRLLQVPGCSAEGGDRGLRGHAALLVVRGLSFHLLCESGLRLLPGCTSTGSCNGTPYYSSCAYCGNSSYNYCAVRVQRELQRRARLRELSPRGSARLQLVLPGMHGWDVQLCGPSNALRASLGESICSGTPTDCSTYSSSSCAPARGAHRGRPPAPGRSRRARQSRPRRSARTVPAAAGLPGVHWDDRALRLAGVVDRVRDGGTAAPGASPARGRSPLAARTQHRRRAWSSGAHAAAAPPAACRKPPGCSTPCTDASPSVKRYTHQFFIGVP